MTDTRQAKANQGNRIAFGILIIIVSLFFFLCEVGAFGGVGAMVKDFAIGFFGLAAFAYALMGIIAGIAVTFRIYVRLRPGKAALLFAMFFIGILALHIYTSSGHIVGANYGGYLFDCYHATNTAGGMLFGIAAYPLMKVVTTVGALVIACAIFLLLALFSLIPVFRRNVTYTATTKEERVAATPRQPRQKREKQVKKKPSKAEKISAATYPVLTDLSAAATPSEGLYVVQVEGDPMPVEGGRRSMGAQGYRPLGSFDPLYPNKNGGYEDELRAPIELSNAYGNSAKDILFGDGDPDRRTQPIAPFSPQTPTSRDAKRNDLLGILGVSSTPPMSAGEYIEKYRASQSESPQPTVQFDGSNGPFRDQAYNNSFSSRSPVFETHEVRTSPLGNDVTPANEPQRENREVVKPERVISLPSAVNPTVLRAQEAVEQSRVNVGVLGAMNKANNGAQPATPAFVKASSASQTSFAQAYEKPEIVEDETPQTPSDDAVKPSAPVDNGEATPPNLEPDHHDDDEKKSETDESKPVVSDDVENKRENAARTGYVSPEYNGYVSKNGEPKVPRSLSELFLERTFAEISDAIDRTTLECEPRSKKGSGPNIPKQPQDINVRKVDAAKQRGIGADKSSAETKYMQVDLKQELDRIQEEEKPRRPYVAPPVTLLDPPVPRLDQEEDYVENSRLIVEKLRTFGVSAEIVQLNKGPAFTRYCAKVELPRGKTVSIVSTYDDDLAMALKVDSVRILAPVPGTDTVGIEVPNRHFSTLTLSECVESEEFKDSKKFDTFVVGKNIEGKTIVDNVDELPHIIIAGATGAGKSCCLNAMIISLLFKATPDDLRFIMIDPKQVELSVYEGIPHMIMDEVIRDVDKAINALQWAETEMVRRLAIFRDQRVRNIGEYNEVCQKSGIRKMYYIAVVIDEFADLKNKGGASLSRRVDSIAAKARAAGIYLIIATQRPSVDVIDGTIKNNIPTRMAFQVSDLASSRTILDSSGAEKLLGRGDMFYRSRKTNNRPMRIQGAFVSTKEVNKIVEFLKENNDSYYDPSVKAEIEHISDKVEEESSGGNKKTKDEGDVNEELIHLLEIGLKMRAEGKGISFSSIQARVGTGYPKAVRLYHMLEDMGYISKEKDNRGNCFVNVTEEEIQSLRKQRDEE